mgnify:CR=1 FL=1
MLAEFFLTALITCSTGQATCSFYEMTDHTRVEVCGILTEDARDRVSPDATRTFEAYLADEKYIVSIHPFCEAY